MLLPKQTRGTLLAIFSAHDVSDVVPSGVCGRGWNERWVRDSWGNADFSDCCRRHDQCYDTCGQEKDQCDRDFHGELRDVCRSAYPSRFHVVQRNACLSAADAYYSAVHRLGGDAYREAQAAAGCG
jgi:hypothetical protein